MPRLETSKDSRAFAWLITGTGLIFPLAGVAAALFGCFKVVVGDFSGLYWIGAGAALIVADMIIDSIWPRSKDAAEEDWERE